MWRGLGRRGAKTETRRVIDRTLGCGVLFQSGRRTAFNPPEIVSYEEWMSWQQSAEQVQSIRSQGDGQRRLR